jgi:arginyl-tRNA--protein-N-Asp/Glu arginylyltransferase
MQKLIVVANCKNCNLPIYGPKSIESQKYLNKPDKEFYTPPELVYTCNCRNIPQEHIHTSPKKGSLEPPLLDKEYLDMLKRYLDKLHEDDGIEKCDKGIESSDYYLPLSERLLKTLIESTYPLTEEGLKGTTGNTTSLQLEDLIGIKHITDLDPRPPLPNPLNDVGIGKY